MEEKAGIRESDPRTWPAAYDVEELLGHPDVLACFTDRLAAAIEQLVGPGAGLANAIGVLAGQLRVSRRSPYDVPALGWHVDGDWFRHTLDCPNQGLLVIGLFTDIQPRWGGTVLALESRRRTARVLAKHPEGLDHRRLFDEALADQLGNFRGIEGRAGDVVLAHPFMFHTRA